MKALNRELVPPFDAFWDIFALEIDVPAHLIETGHRAVFGSECYQEGSGRLPGWMELPDGPLSYHVAHELTHLLIQRRGFPTTMRGPQYGADSHEARVGGDLMETVHHHTLEDILSPFAFDRTHIQRHLFEGARRGIEMSPVPESDTPWWATWACRFCELQYLLPRERWVRLEVVYDSRCPDIADKGRELADIMLREGYHTPDQSLQAMIKVRDALGLGEADRCLVLDTRDGKRY